MDYVFLLDISGSMQNDSKLVISRNSLEAFINELGPNDRFEVMTFNVKPNMLFGEMQPATAEMKEQAGNFMATQSARGGTQLAPAMNTAYKYGDPDRTLNVVVLSDGMTDQGERQTLLQLIQGRPRFARVFCIGIGNDVNRPLLEQIAEDSGGLAAFISRGDNFKRAAKSFRRKLMRPVATDLAIDFNGLTIYDVEPKKLPNLYHGAPIRIYGRYSGQGNAALRMKANVQGIELDKTAEVVFPAEDLDNPEIERMWAWKRVDQFLKQADRTGSRQSVLDEIIKLGEEYSIVTEYTSFLVLENDGEYKRWKIDRRNVRRLDRDRKAQEKLKNQLAQIRDKASLELEPQALSQKAKEEPKSKPQPRQTQVSSRQAPQQRPSRGFDLDLGSGPVGPLGLVFAFWLNRRKKRNR